MSFFVNNGVLDSAPPPSPFKICTHASIGRVLTNYAALLWVEVGPGYWTTLPGKAAPAPMWAPQRLRIPRRINLCPEGIEMRVLGHPTRSLLSYPLSSPRLLNILHTAKSEFSWRSNRAPVRYRPAVTHRDAHSTKTRRRNAGVWIGEQSSVFYTWGRGDIGYGAV